MSGPTRTRSLCPEDHMKLSFMAHSLQRWLQGLLGPCAGCFLLALLGGLAAPWARTSLSA